MEQARQRRLQMTGCLSRLGTEYRAGWYSPTRTDLLLMHARLIRLLITVLSYPRRLRHRRSHRGNHLQKPHFWFQGLLSAAAGVV